ncbi:hypothetical protein QE152_g6777 [Popillia japonica]|uniref:Retroviral polymerase SH3-like domain-containing protein n=1 Tax=Popillia japonica TaxID=7064 RepID=A0AAW1MHC5_POPJA
MNRTIVEKAKSILIEAKLPTEYWAEAASTAVYLINRAPASATRKTPEEAFSHIPKGSRKRWDEKSKELDFVDYRLINPLTKKLVRSRDVVILQNEFYNREQHSGRSLQEFSPNLLENSEKVNYNREQHSGRSLQEFSPNLLENSEKVNEDHQNDEENQNDENTEEDLSNEESDCDENLERNGTDDDEYYEFNAPLDTNREIRRSSRQPKPKQINDYISFLAEKYISEPQTVQEALESPEPKSIFLNHKPFKKL